MGEKERYNAQVAQICAAKMDRSDSNFFAYLAFLGTAHAIVLGLWEQFGAQGSIRFMAALMGAVLTLIVAFGILKNRWAYERAIVIGSSLSRPLDSFFNEFARGWQPASKNSSVEGEESMDDEDKGRRQSQRRLAFSTFWRPFASVYYATSLIAAVLTIVWVWFAAVWAYSLETSPALNTGIGLLLVGLLCLDFVLLRQIWRQANSDPLIQTVREDEEEKELPAA